MSVAQSEHAHDPRTPRASPWSRTHSRSIDAGMQAAKVPTSDTIVGKESHIKSPFNV